MTIQFFDAAFTSTTDGLFFPVSSLPGISPSELATGESSSKKHSKFLFSFLDTLFEGINSSSILGFILSKTQPTVVGLSNLRVRYNITTHRVVNTADSSVKTSIPSNTNNDGELVLNDIFPGIELISNLDEKLTGGVLIPLEDLTAYGLPGTPGDRDLLITLIDFIFYDAGFTVRSQSSASAIITKAVGSSTLLNIPNEAYDAINPTTGLEAQFQGLEYILQKTFNIILELEVAASSSEISFK